jgi:uncharacterized protein
MGHEFEIPISHLDAGGRDVTFPLRGAWVRGALEGHEATSTGKDGVLALRASKSGTDVVLRGHLDVELVAPCARCLEPVTFAVTEDISWLMVPRAAHREPGAGEYEMTALDADTFPYDGETLILDDLVRDELVLETPMIPLCSEDCPGMSPPRMSTREGGGVDPRLLPLLHIKPQKP